MEVLPEHVVLEVYSVLTRLPSGLAVPAETAASVLARRFGAMPLRLGQAARHALAQTLADAGVHGGAAYDGLVALEAHEHRRMLMTLDVRARITYRRLGVAFATIAA